MRTPKIIEHISLDGVIQHSADGGDFPYSDWTARRVSSCRWRYTARCGRTGA